MFLNKIFNFVKKERKTIFLVVFLIIIYIINVFFIPEKNLEHKDVIKEVETEIQIALSNISIFEKLKEDIFLKWVIIIFLIISVLFIISGFVIDLYYIFSRKKIIIPRTQNFIGIEWNFIDIFKILVVIFSAGYGFAIFTNIFFNFLGININTNIINPLIFSTFFHIIAVTCVIFYVKFKYNSGFNSLGLNFSRKIKNIFIGILGYSSIIPLVILLLLISIIVFYYIGYESEPNPIFLVYFLPIKISKLIYLLIFISVIGPVCEEIFFRGFLYKFLRGRLGITFGIILNSAIFSFLHFAPIGFIPIFILSIMLSYMYEKTGSLIAPITAHILHNSMISIFMLILRGMIY